MLEIRGDGLTLFTNLTRYVVVIWFATVDDRGLRWKDRLWLRREKSRDYCRGMKSASKSSLEHSKLGLRQPTPESSDSPVYFSFFLSLSLLIEHPNPCHSTKTLLSYLTIPLQPFVCSMFLPWCFCLTLPFHTQRSSFVSAAVVRAHAQMHSAMPSLCIRRATTLAGKERLPLFILPCFLFQLPLS